MDLKHIENAMKDSEGRLVQKDVIKSNIEQSNSNNTNSSSALQQFLNHITISSNPCITTSLVVLELNSDDCLKDAISWLYEKNVFGAPITDMANFDAGCREIYRLENNCRVVYGDESISDALHSMWENQTDAVPVVDLKTKTLIGYVRNNAIHLLLDSDALFNNRKSLPVGKFVHSDSGKSHHSLDSTTESNLGILLSAGILCP
ncbi:hypothetical protein AAC387_Pa10g1094 [Persea americana]